MIRLATIGTSSISHCLLEAVEAVEGVSYVGTYSRDAERAADFTARHNGTKPFISLDELADSDEVDAVYIASPNALHHDQALRCIRGGKHVLVEKPFASNAREAAEVFGEAWRAGVVAMEAMLPVHNPAFHALRDALGELGPIRRATLRMGKYSSRYDEILAGRRTNIFDCELASGALMDIGCYTVEPLVELFGAPEAICAAGALLDGDTRELTHGPLDGAGVILASYPTMVASLHYAKNVNDLASSQVEGEKGTLTIDSIESPTAARLDLRETCANGGSTGYSAIKTATRELDLPTVETGMIHELSDFAAAIEAVRTGADPHEAAAGPFGTIGHFRDVTLDSLAIMDEARRHMGVVFPADR